MKRPLQALLITSDATMRRNIITGDKQITIREGERDFDYGPCMLCCEKEPWAVMVDIVEVHYCSLSEVTTEELTADGFTSQKGLLAGMRRFYPDLTLDSIVTVIRWENARGKFVNQPALHEQHVNHLLVDQRSRQRLKRGDRVKRVETGQVYIVREQFIDGSVTCTNLDGRPAELQTSGLEKLPRRKH